MPTEKECQSKIDEYENLINTEIRHKGSKSSIKITEMLINEDKPNHFNVYCNYIRPDNTTGLDELNFIINTYETVK